jgi:hypothetical protein
MQSVRESDLSQSCGAASLITDFQIETKHPVVLLLLVLELKLEMEVLAEPLHELLLVLALTSVLPETAQ